MIQNKQVSIWRGSSEPPTLYHLWLRNETELLRYDDQQSKWIVFLDSANLDQKITQFLEMLSAVTVNGYHIMDSPELDGEDIRIKFEGNYLKDNQTIDEALATLDALMTTKVYGQ